MKKMIRRTLALALVTVILAGCSQTPSQPSGAAAESSAAGESAAAGSSAAEPETPQEILKVRFVLPKADSPQMDVVTDAVNKKMAEDGVPLELIPLNVPQNVYNDRINMMFAGGEEFEILNVMENVTPFYVYINNDYIIPIDDLLREHGKHLMETIGRDLGEGKWLGTQINDETYTIPNHWKDIAKTGGDYGMLGVPKAKMEEYGLEIPTTSEELFDFAKTVKTRWMEDDPEMAKEAYLWLFLANQLPIRILRSAERFPFYVDFSTELMLITQDGEMEPYYESSEFREAANWMKRAYDADLIHPDILTMTNSDRAKFVNRGTSLGGSVLNTVEDDPASPENQVLLNPSVPVLNTIPALNTNAISSTAPNPEAGIMFLDWLYADPENMNLMVYGIEDVHYKVYEDNRYEFMKDAENKLLYDFKLWQVGQAEHTRFDRDVHENYPGVQIDPYENSIDSIALGFVFDPTPVQTEYQAILAEIPRSIYPIKMGVQDYDTHFPDSIKRLKELGYDRVIEEYKVQFEKWRQDK